LINKAIMDKSSFISPRTNERTIFELEKAGVHVTMNREYQSHNKSYAYKYGLKFKNLEVTNRLQNKIDENQVPNHIIKLLQEVPKTIESKKWDMKYNLRHLDSNKENVKIGFPKDKILKIDTLKNEIKEIKRTRGRKI
jgi:hypothetical protein